MLFCGSRFSFPRVYTQSISHIYCRSLISWSHDLRMARVKGILKNKMESCRLWYIDFTNRHNSSTSCILTLCCPLSLWKIEQKCVVPFLCICHVTCIVQWDIRKYDKAEAWWVPVHSHFPLFVFLCSLVLSPGDTWLHCHASKPIVSRPPTCVQAWSKPEELPCPAPRNCELVNS